MGSEKKIDSKDRKIIEILLNDAESSLRKIAREVSLSPSSIRNRILRLKEIGVIKKFTISLDYYKLGYSIQVIIMLTCKTGFSESVYSRLKKIPQVHDIFWTTGPANFLILVRVADMNELTQLITGKLEHTEGIEKIETMFLMPRTECKKRDGAEGEI